MVHLNLNLNNILVLRRSLHTFLNQIELSAEEQDRTTNEKNVFNSDEVEDENNS